MRTIISQFGVQLVFVLSIVKQSCAYSVCRTQVSFVELRSDLKQNSSEKMLVHTDNDAQQVVVREGVDDRARSTRTVLSRDTILASIPMPYIRRCLRVNSPNIGVYNY